VRKEDLITLLDWEAAEIRAVLDLAHSMKKSACKGALPASLAGKTIALVFEKSSMRTRVSFEVAIGQLGGHSIYLSQRDIGLGKREPVKDVARALSRYVDGIIARVYAHASVEELARHATVPVINALSDQEHPCQALGDLMTIEEKCGSLDHVTVAYIGDANNVARSLAVGCAKLGVNYRLACPKAYQFKEGFRKEVESLTNESGASFTMTESPQQAAAGADVLYTDTWVSMGEEAEAERRLRDFQGYCIDAELVSRASPSVIVMHCLPAYRGNEITDEVIEGAHSAVFDQAENRLHAQRALLHLLVGG